MHDKECAFCRIAEGGDPTVEILCEGPAWVAFFPRDPATPGHTLIVPRQHVPDVWALDPSLGADLMDAVIKVGRAIQDAVTPAGLNLISSAGEVAEQSVFHLHLHIVPRYPGDDLHPIWPPKGEIEERDLSAMAGQIRRACARPH